MVVQEKEVMAWFPNRNSTGEVKKNQNYVTRAKWQADYFCSFPQTKISIKPSHIRWTYVVQLSQDSVNDISYDHASEGPHNWNSLPKGSHQTHVMQMLLLVPESCLFSTEYDIVWHCFHHTWQYYNSCKDVDLQKVSRVNHILREHFVLCVPCPPCHCSKTKMFRHLARSRVYVLSKISRPIPRIHPVLISPPWHTITDTTLHTISSSSSNNPVQQIQRQRDVDRKSRAACSRSAGVFALVLISGLVGFGLAHSDFFDLKAHSRKDTTSYGSPEDFKKAIKELQGVFGPEEDSPGELVTTNPDVLHDHGYSPLIHHEGEPFLFLRPVIRRCPCLSIIRGGSHCCCLSSIDWGCNKNCQNCHQI